MLTPSESLTEERQQVREGGRGSLMNKRNEKTTISSTHPKDHKGLRRSMKKQDPPPTSPGPAAWSQSLFTWGMTSAHNRPRLRGWRWLRRLLDVLGMFYLWRHEGEQLNDVNYWPIWKTSCPWAVHLQTTQHDLDLALLNKTPWGCGRKSYGSGIRPPEVQALRPSSCVPLDKWPYYSLKSDPGTLCPFHF